MNKKVKKSVKNNKKNTRVSRNAKINKNYKTKKVKVKKLRIGRVILALIVLLFIGFVIKSSISIPITNIYVSGNSILSDQEIIELASLENYPSLTSFTNYSLKNKLEKNTYILKATIKRKNLRQIYINILENKPIVYLDEEEKTVLLDGTKVDYRYNVPTILNYIPDTLYDKFLEKLSNIDSDIFNRISDIMYKPVDEDDELFLFYMEDGNEVYVTLKTLNILNDYFDIMKKVKEKYKKENGILYLDDGEYFEPYKN